jgi:hypothetical protein
MPLESTSPYPAELQRRSLDTTTLASLAKPSTPDPEYFMKLLGSSLEQFNKTLVEAVKSSTDGLALAVVYSKLTTPAFSLFASIALHLVAQNKSAGDASDAMVIDTVIREYMNLGSKVEDLLNGFAYRAGYRRRNEILSTSSLQLLELCRSWTIDIWNAHDRTNPLLAPPYKLLTVSHPFLRDYLAHGI